MPNAERKRPLRREERVSRTYRLPLSKLKAAQRALGAATATAEDRVRGDDTGYLHQRASADLPAAHRESTALGVR